MSARVFGSGSSSYPGNVFPNGDIVDGQGIRRGRISPQGELRDNHGRLIGRIYQNGEFTNIVGRSARLQMVPNGDIRVRDETIGRVQIAWGMKIPDLYVAYAAAFLLNRPTWVWQ